MRSEVAVAHTLAGYNSGRMKLATAAKEFVVPQNISGRKAAEDDDDNRSLVAYMCNSALGFENEKFTEHIIKTATCLV
jgi:hypothetical protein